MRHAHLQAPHASLSSSSSAQKPILCTETLDADTATFVRLLRTCSNSKNLTHGRNVHHHIVACAHEHDLSLLTLLVQLYVKCASLEDAKASFLRSNERNLDAWNCLIGAYADESEGREGFKLFQQMQQEAVMADNITMLSMLSVCTSEGDLIAGRQIHVQISCSVSERNLVIVTALVNMYGKAGSMVDAHKIFTNMSARNVVSWSCMIALCTKYGKHKEVFHLFDGMLQEGVLPNTFTFVSMLSACACPTLAKTGKCYHARLVGSELEQHPYMGNALTNMYGRCGFLKEADSSFDMACKQGAYSWNIILAAHAHHGNIVDAIKLFNKMLEEKVLPDTTTFVNLLSACANQMALSEGMDIHAFITLVGLDSDTAVSNSLLNMYGKCNHLDVAQKLLKEMPEHDVVSWNTLLSGYAQHNLGMEAFQVFQQMIQEGMSPNQVTYTCILDALACEEVLAEGKQIHACVISQLNVVITTALVNMYGKCGSLREALKVFHSRKIQNVLLWNAVFAVCNQNEQGGEALDLFAKMYEEDVLPDNFTFSNVLSSCASQAAVTTGKKIHALAIEYGFAQDMVVGTALVNMYGKCGSLADAMGVFNTIHNRDLILWTAIIQASSQHGQGKEAIRLLNQMQRRGVVPNKITFLSALSACSHSGLLNEGRRCFTSMKEDYGIIPAEEHYDCMIDLLARSGLLEEAEKLMRAMPFRATYVSWTTLLGACRNENDVERGERVGKHLIDLYPERASPYIVLSQIYTAAGREDDSEAIMNQMKVRTIKKQIGYSTIEVNGRVHKFLSDEQSHPDKREIYAELERMDWQLKNAGYEPGLRSVTEEEREDKPCVHSEKLATAFGVISTVKGTPLLVTKNLRICLDCHSFLKAFSKLYQRQITIRDAHRFHRMVDGACSCADYW